MNPAPQLHDLIRTVQADATSDDPLDRLSTAAHTAADLEESADSLLAHFVDQCRRSGRSWTEISAALGVSKQAAHKRFNLASPSMERFTERAKRVLDATSGVARELGHGYVGTEHLLLAQFEQAQSVAAQVLDEAGITRDAVVEKLLDSVPRGAATGDVDRPYTPRAAECLGATLTEALGMGHNYIGTEHMLLGLYSQPEGLAAQILADFGLTKDDVRAAVIQKLAGFPNT